MIYHVHVFESLKTHWRTGKFGFLHLQPTGKLGRKKYDIFFFVCFCIYHKIERKRVVESIFSFEVSKLFHVHILQAHIERALHDHFLFRKLTDSQCHVLLDCMQRVEVQAGDIVVKQV